MGERAKMANLVRYVSGAAAIPTISIGLAFLVFTDPSEHWLHIAGLVPLGVVALVVFVMAPRLATRWVPT